MYQNAYWAQCSVYLYIFKSLYLQKSYCTYDIQTKCVHSYLFLDNYSTKVEFILPKSLCSKVVQH
jgi:hypothetical protein